MFAPVICMQEVEPTKERNAHTSCKSELEMVWLKVSNSEVELGFSIVA